MNMHIATGLLTATLALAPLLLVAACGAARPVTAGPLTPSTATTVPSPQPVTLAETRGTVAISDEIRKACGIADEDAYFSFDSSTVLSTGIRPLNPSTPSRNASASALSRDEICAWSGTRTLGDPLSTT